MAELTEQYSTTGPICPHCLLEFTPDEPFYYDEHTTELDCDCGERFAVEVYHETSWTTRARTKNTPDSQRGDG